LDKPYGSKKIAQHFFTFIIIQLVLLLSTVNAKSLAMKANNW